MPSSPSPSPDFQLESSWNPRWNPIVIALVGAICSVFLFLSYYRTHGRRCFIFSFRSRSRRRLLNEANLDDPSSSQFLSRGLDSAIIQALATIQFRDKIEGGSGESNTACAVCLGEFEEGDWLRLLPNCVHVFHISCIDTWFQSHSNCPICRSNVISIDSSHSDRSLPMFPLMETLRREDVVRERAVRYQVLRSEIMQNLAVRWGTTNNDHHESSSEESIISTISSSAVKNNYQNMDSMHETDDNPKKGGSSSRDGYNNRDMLGSSSTTEEFREPS